MNERHHFVDVPVRALVIIICPISFAGSVWRGALAGHVSSQVKTDIDRVCVSGQARGAGDELSMEDCGGGADPCQLGSSGLSGKKPLLLLPLTRRQGRFLKYRHARPPASRSHDTLADNLQ